MSQQHLGQDRSESRAPLGTDVPVARPVDTKRRGGRATSPRAASIGSPAAWALALVLCFLPFLSVSCDTPGGFGRMEAGGTTTWSGFDLAVGSSPSVDEANLRPSAEQQPDDLGWQPTIAIGLLSLAAALVLASLRRWQAAMVAGFAGAILVAIGSMVARSELVDMVAAQATEPFAAGTSAGDHVALGVGFWIVVVLALLGSVLAALGAKQSGVDQRRRAK